MNVVDALFVTLGLDPTAFKKGHKETQEAMDKTKEKSTAAQKQIEADAKKAAEGLSKLRNEVLGMIAAFVGVSAIKGFAEHITRTDAATGRLSVNLGMATEKLSAWEQAAARYGSSAGDIDSAFQRTLKLVQDIKIGKFDPEAFKMLGWAQVEISKFTSAATPLEEKLKMVQAAMGKLSAQDAQTFGTAAGYSSETITFLRATAANIGEVLALEKERGVVTQRDTDEANARNKAWLDVTTTLKRLGRNILQDLQPAIIGVLNWATKFFTFFKEHTTLAEIAVTLLTATMAALIAVKFLPLITGIGGMTTALGAMSVVATGLLGLLGRISLLFAAFTGGYMIGTWIYDNLSDKVKDNIGAGIAWVLEKFGIGEIDHTERNRAESGARSSAGPASGGSAPASGGSSSFAALEKKYGLPEGLLDSVWAQESGRGKNMRSKAGAEGHFQFMPKTARQYGLKNPYDLAESSEAAAHKLSDLLKLFGGDLTKALSAYNWGEGNVMRKGLNRAPLETLQYAPQIQARMAMAGRGNTTNTSTSDMKINQVAVYTQATDAQGIASAFSSAMQNYAFASNANYGAA